MAAYRQVYDSRHVQADCQEPGSVPETYARQSSIGYLYFLHDQMWLQVNLRNVGRQKYARLDIQSEQLQVITLLSQL